jgi:uncharacterized protein (TIGR03435 family)
VIAAGGAKMARSPADQPRPKYKHPGDLSVSAARMTMPRLAEMLSNVAGQPVVDKTGLTGTFAISFQASTPSTEAGLSAPGDDPPDVFRAVQEELGLKLRATNGRLDVLVIDHIERTPTGN